MNKHHYLQWATNQPLKFEKLVLLYLSTIADEYGNPVTLSIKDLTDYLMCSRQTVIRYIKTLEKYGLLTVNKSSGFTNSYTLNSSVQIMTSSSYFQDIGGAQ